MAIAFNSSTGLSAEETTEIRARIASEFKEAFKNNAGEAELNTEPETPAGQIIDGMAALVSEKDSEVLYLSNNFNPAAATGIFQDALANIYFLERHVAEPTLVTCQCYGLQGTVIPYGAVVQDENGYTFYNTLAGTIPAEGIYESIFRCSEYGAIQVGAETVTKIITMVPGWDSVNNTAAGITGRDEETQAEFEQRRYASVAKNSHGLAESVEGTVGNLDGVIACRIEQNRTNVDIETLGVTIPGHSVYLSVYGGEPDEIGLAMHQKLDAGCGTSGNTKVTINDETNGSEQTFYFEIPETAGVGIKIEGKATSSTAETVESDVKSAILANFNGETSEHSRCRMGETIYASRFYKTAIEAGVENLESIHIAFPAGSEWVDSVEIPLDKMPTLSEDDISVIIEE